MGSRGTLGPTNGARRAQRPGGVPHGGRGAQLHAGGEAAGRVAIGVEPRGPGPRRAARRPPARQNDAQRGADRRRRAVHRPAAPGPRRRPRRAGPDLRAARPAGRARAPADAAHGGADRPRAEAGALRARLPRRRARRDDRQQPARSGRRGLRRRHPARRVHRAGHGRRPRLAGSPCRHRRLAGLLRVEREAEVAARSDPPSLHQLPARQRWHLSVGVRQRQAVARRRGDGPADHRRHRDRGRRGDRRRGPRVHRGGAHARRT